jgi:hypothetical protein
MVVLVVVGLALTPAVVLLAVRESLDLATTAGMVTVLVREVVAGAALVLLGKTPQVHRWLALVEPD